MKLSWLGLLSLHSLAWSCISHADRLGVSVYNDMSVRGGILVPAVQSLLIKKGTYWPGINSPTQCAKYCAALSECNSYTYCTLKEGCPGDCSKFADEKRRVRKANNFDANIISLPLQGIGPYFNGCVEDKTTKTSRWPKETCMLLDVKDVEAPTFHTEGAGWLSGVFPLTKACGKGISPAACSRCLASKDKEACLQCAKKKAAHPKDVPRDHRLYWYSEDYFKTAQEQCGLCSHLNGHMDKYHKCLDCRLCQLCVADKVQLDKCIDCVLQSGRLEGCRY